MLFLGLFILLGFGGLNSILWLYPLLSSSFWYGGAARSNDFLSDEMDDSRPLMPLGMSLIIDGGWLLSLCINNIVLLGLVYGLYVLYVCGLFVCFYGNS